MRLFTTTELVKWLAHAKAGDVLVYYQGKSLGQAKAQVPTIDRLASAVYALGDCTRILNSTDMRPEVLPIFAENTGLFQLTQEKDKRSYSYKATVLRKPTEQDIAIARTYEYATDKELPKVGRPPIAGRPAKIRRSELVE